MGSIINMKMKVVIKKEIIQLKVIIEIWGKKMEQYKKNNYEFEQLSNVKNIMDNMKKNKMK